VIGFDDFFGFDLSLLFDLSPQNDGIACGVLEPEAEQNHVDPLIGPD
jgi:hypothetical protein